MVKVWFADYQIWRHFPKYHVGRILWAHQHDEHVLARQVLPSMQARPETHCLRRKNVELLKSPDQKNYK